MAAKKNDGAIYRYLGTGEFYNGIPARDLTQEDFDALGEQEQAVVRTGDLYRDLAAKAPANPTAPSAQQPAE